MAVKDGLPATDFSRMNREYIKAVAEGGSGGGGGSLDSTYFFVKTEENPDADDPVWTMRTVATAKEILDAMYAGKILIGYPGDTFNCGNAGHDQYFLVITNITPNPSDSAISVSALNFEYVDAADIATAHFIMNENSRTQSWTVNMTPDE